MNGRVNKCGELIGAYHKNTYSSTVDPNDKELWTYSENNGTMMSVTIIYGRETSSKGYK